MTIARILSYIFEVLNFKTLYFNFKYLPFTQAIKLPFLISRRCRFRTIKGEVKLNGPIRPGMIIIGCGSVGIFDNKRSRSIWDVSGTVIFEGNAIIGHGCKISVGGGGNLRIGNNFKVTAESSIAVVESVTIGSDCLFSWEILVMDTDWHPIINDENTIINPPAAIVIGNHVWVGCRTTILKGVHIADNNIIAAGSLITRSITQTHAIIGGSNTLRPIKENVSWRSK